MQSKSCRYDINSQKRKCRKKIDFTTNGLLFDRNNIDRIIDSGVDTIRVSLQGLDSDAYMKVCGVKLDFDKFIDNLTYLYEHRGSCKVRMKIADVAIKDIPDGERKFEEIFGSIADSIFVEHIIPMFESVDYSADVYKNAINGRENVKQKQIHKVCHRPFYRMRVAANGKVTAACCDVPQDIILGDINENTLSEIWRGGGTYFITENAA